MAHAAVILRRLARDRAFTLPALGVLVLAAGASAALFTVVHTVLLRPLPFTDADRLVTLCERHATLEGFCNVSPPNLSDLTAGAPVAAAGVARDWSFQITLDGQRLRVASGLASEGTFRALGLVPALGRLPRPDEEGATDGRVVLISHRVWRDAFAASPAALGRTLHLDGVGHSVVGVLPERGTIPTLEDVDVWRPLHISGRDEEARGWRGFRSYARLVEGVSLADARALLERRYAELGTVHAEVTPEWRLAVLPLRDRVVGDVRPTLLVLAAAVALLVLIAGANTVGLQLVREVRGGRVRAIRAALGASRGVATREALGEALLLGAFAGLLALAPAAALLAGLRRVAPPGLPRLDEVAFSLTTALFALAVAVTLPVLGAAVIAARPEPDRTLANRLRQGVGSGEAPARARLRRGLVAAELALSLVLLATAVALVRSFAAYRAWNPGFDPGDVITAFAGVSSEEAPTRADVLPVWLSGEDALRTLSGVRSVATTSAGPLFGGRETAEVKAFERETSSTAARWYDAGPGYFAALSIPLLRGRDLAESDVAGAPPVVVVNETLARRVWPSGEALGRRLLVDDEDEPLTVVGIAADRAPLTPGLPPEPELWWSNRQRTRWGTTFVVRLSEDSPASIQDVQATLDAAHPALDAGPFTPLAARLDRALVTPRFHMLLLGGFAVLAALLAAAGLYGLLSFAVTQRLREMGVRLALGATRKQVVGEVARWAAAPVVVGLSVGLPLALASGTVLDRLLPGLTGPSPGSLAGATAALAVTALLAVAHPALRAGRAADPLALLKD